MAADGAPGGWLDRFHFGSGTATGSGVMRVRRGSGWAASALCAVLRLPESGDRVQVRVRVIRSPGRPERWLRDFASRSLNSWQTRAGEQLVERVGPLELRMRIVTGESSIRLLPDALA